MTPETKYPNINRFFVVVQQALFRTTSELNYQETIEAILRLAQEIIDTDTSDDECTVWYMGESSDCSLDALIVGAYWFFSEYHDGQDSLEYRALSKLGEIFKPGMTSGPEPESSEKDVYEMLEQKYNEAQALHRKELGWDE